jgi:amino acid transporter
MDVLEAQPRLKAGRRLGLLDDDPSIGFVHRRCEQRVGKDVQILLGDSGLAGLVVPVAVAAIAALTVLVLMGIQRSNRANIAIVSITVFALVFFVVAGFLAVWAKGSLPWSPFFRPSADSGGPWGGLLEATALMFVAFTGYAHCHPWRGINSRMRWVAGSNASEHLPCR